MKKEIFAYEFRTLYLKTREAVKEGNAKVASAHVVGFVEHAKEYGDDGTIAGRAQLEEFVLKWSRIATVLDTCGITVDVLNAFEIELRTETVASDITVKDKSTEATLSDSQGWAADLYEKNKNAVVSIGTSTGSGTGFIISKNGYILTNEHLLFNKLSGKFLRRISFSFAESSRQFNMQLLVSDKKSDVALCWFDPIDTPEFCAVTRVEDYSQVKQGADVLVIGNGFSFGLAPITGTIKYVREIFSNDLVYTVPTNPGDSGAPVFIRNGECIGINKSITRTVNSQGTIVPAIAMSNATPMNIINDLLSEWSVRFNLTI